MKVLRRIKYSLIKIKMRVINFFSVAVVKHRCKKLNIKYVNDCYVGKNVRTLGYKPKIILNEGSRIADDCVLWGSGTIIIGKNSHLGEYGWIHAYGDTKVVIGENVNFAAFPYIINCDHLTKKGTVMMKQGLVAEDIIIGNDIWFGANVTILKGTVLADGCVVGAGSVIKGKYLEENSIICGYKAKVLKYRE